MPPKKSKTLRKALNERNAERRWSGENVDFGAVLDGKNEFLRADDTTTDSSSESVTADAATVQPPIAALTQPPCRAVTSLRKLETMKAVKGEIQAGPHQPTSRDWCIIDVGQLNKVITDVFCPACHSVGTLSVMKNGQPAMGFAESLHLQCTNCQYTGGSVYSSPRLHDSAKLNVAFEINTVMTMLVHELGKGHAALQKFQTVLGLNNMHLKTFQRHNRKVHQVCQSVADTSLDTATEIIRGVYGDLMDDTGVIDITVSYDGTWQKRGFTSHHGVGVAIEVQTGLVIDYEVLSNYCHACALAENSLGKGTAALQAWKAAHTACDNNFDGSSKAMEAEAARRMWARSLEKYAFRYTTILSDGDASTFAALTQLEPYGPDHVIVKLDCLNHAEKRMGTALRKAAKASKLGGRGDGQLTGVKATKLQLYYGRALRSNVGNADATRDAVWATLFHSTSTDADPHHTRCPRGLDSWCCFNKSVALGLPMPQHNPHTVGTMLDRDVTFKLVPIYERMTDDNLLVRMTTGGTQNANESLNSLIWLYCPKTQFVGHRTVVSAVQSAVARFNGGATATTERLLCLGVQPTEMQMACMVKEDDRRVKRAEKAADNATKSARKSRQSAQKRALAELEASEGVQYAAGAF